MKKMNHTQGHFKDGANRWLVIAAIAVLFSISCGGGGGDSRDPNSCVDAAAIGVQLGLAFPNLVFTQPVALLQSPLVPDRWYVVEQTGRVLTFSGVNARVADVFIDISDRIATGSEAGLLSMAFHPDFFNNGIFFLSYTGPGLPFVSYISKFSSADGGITANAATEQIILSVDQPYVNHNGGHIAFGPLDGYLYIGFGDGGLSGDPGGNSQNTETLLGALLRIDTDGAPPYAVPATNPFASSLNCGPGSNCPEIYAWGFRNPWRFSFDTGTGNLWLGDVGGGAREEIDRVENGANYGWSTVEGTLCLTDPNCDTSGLSPPVVEYGHDVGVSVTGGYVYRGNDIAELLGEFVFGDFGSGRIWHLSSDSQSAQCPNFLLDSGINIAAFSQDDSGEIYVISYSDGRIYQCADTLF